MVIAATNCGFRGNTLQCAIIRLKSNVFKAPSGFERDFVD
jgi:hypothetical protein